VTLRNISTPRAVSVTAKAEIEVQPDEVLISLGMSTVDKELLTAKSDNDAKTRAVLDLADKYRLEDSCFQITNLTIEPAYEQQEHAGKSKSVFVGYHVHRAIKVTLTNFDIVEALTSDALKAGVSQLDGILFRTRKHAEHQVEVRKRAVEYAREKATHLAELNGLALGKAVTIEEGIEGDEHVSQGQTMVRLGQQLPLLPAR
jgi:uncharacterized protein YggE